MLAFWQVSHIMCQKGCSSNILSKPLVPQVLKSCTEFIEKHGVVDGMYRLSGIASNIQKLR